MQTLSLGSTGRTTTRLGFGCSSIMGALDRRQSLALLESAFDAGIRHFDTAPMYGYGDAEGCLGEFLNRHREITITTKFGIPPPTKDVVKQAMRAAARPVLQLFPALKSRLQRTTVTSQRGEAQEVRRPNPIFTAEAARSSLERSLTALRTDHIDLWLLHDVAPIDLAADSANDPLLRMMQDAVREGKIGMFGIGSDREIVPDLMAKHPEYCTAVQYEWSVLNPPNAETGSFRIHHRALSQHFRELAETVRTSQGRRARWSHEVGQDVGDPETLARLMLKASCVLNPSSLLLFSSKQPEHIRTNVAVAGDVALVEPARRLYELAQRERLHTTAV